MNLFWKNLLGRITSTAKIEAAEKELISSMKRYDEVAKSVELAEYQKLFHEVKSAQFIENKKTLQNRRYKDTEEHRDIVKFRKLENSKGLKMYLDVLKSMELEQFLAFKQTKEYEDLGDPKKVKLSEKLQKMKKFERSPAYKNYVRFHDSYLLKEYEQLKNHVNSPEFKSQNEFWANPQRWKTTSEYKKEQRYYELVKNPDIIFYNNEKPERFQEYKSVRLTYNEEFDWNTLDKSRWDFGFHYGHPNLKGCHSFANELQANNAGKNVAVENGILKIATKEERVKAPAWHTTKGFIEKEYEYTSDVLQSAESFRQKGGVFRAKIRCTGRINHAFWLGVDQKFPHINIFHFDGKAINVGNAGKNVIDGAKIKGLNPAQFYIYTLKWTDKDLVWLINDYEVYRTSSNIPKEEMFMVFNSFIPEKLKGATGCLEVDWVRVYQY
ncbi:MAG: hypothetical protein PHH37_06610 [Paludibacter sp.]|nr:hypothetical protein [Paludibacter sp.]